jgi:hypothetical protein
MAVFAVIVVGLVVLVQKVSNSMNKPKPKAKTFYDVIKKDDERLRAEPEPVATPQPEPKPEKVTEPAQPQAEQPKPVKPAPPQFKTLTEIEQVEAERLFEWALNCRKQGRLPGIGYKNMVDVCRDIISRFPQTNYDYKARRILADIPERYRSRYNITEEEINLSNSYLKSK